MAARSDYLAGDLRVHHYFSLPAGESRRHQHDAFARRPGAHLRQQVCVPPGADPARRHCCVPLSSRSFEEFYQTGDWAGGRQHPHRVGRSIRQRAGARGRLRSRRLTPTSVRMPRSWFLHTATSCWATIAPCRTTAATLGRSTSALSTAKPCSGIGRWTKWEECGEESVSFQLSAIFAVKSF